MRPVAQATALSTIQRVAATLGFGVFAALGAALLALATPGAASAHGAIPFHAKLAHADPAIGAVLKSAPTKVTLGFLEDLKPDGSDIVVYDDHGKQVSVGSATVTSGNAKEMTVNMQGDDSETYVVYFHTVSADDGDPYTDAYQFTVSSSATASTGQQPDSNGDSISSVSHTPSSSGSSGVQPLVAALIGVIALVIGAAGGFFFASRQHAG
jgi:methionine-rich copper-binding protein CopC